MTERGGYMSPTVLDQQFAVLHDAYKEYNITFKLAGSEHVVNPDWAGNCKLEMKKALHNGTYADLNVYFFPRIFCIRQKRNLWSWLSLLGYSQFPDDGIVGTEAQYGDAVHVRSVAAPGGHDFILGENFLGTTLVHETGHWLGRKYSSHLNLWWLADIFPRQYGIPSRAVAQALMTWSMTRCRRFAPPARTRSVTSDQRHVQA
jgi:hypothetical protein